MQITATEFKTNMGKYLSMASRRDIYITKNGQRIAKLTNPSPDRIAMLDSLVGIAKAEAVSLEDIKRERLEEAGQKARRATEIAQSAMNCEARDAKRGGPKNV